MVDLTSLWLPILLSTVAMFFLGFMSYMVFGFHAKDWAELPDEDGFSDSIRERNIPIGNYMFPYCANAEQMKSEAFIEKQKQGPVGLLQVWQPGTGMGKQLACQFIFLLVTSFCLAYLATIALEAGAEFMQVFRFVGTAGMLTFTAANVPTTIWYQSRLSGHVIDGVLNGLAIGLIFAALWPAAVAS